MQLGRFQIEEPLVLGPMAGVTDWAFRTICAQLGANMTVTEMVSVFIQICTKLSNLHTIKHNITQ